jgi:hypothetical protein
MFRASTLVAPAALVALSAGIIVAGTTTVAGADRSQPLPGSQTRATATPVLPGETTPARLVLGERSVRSQAWFVLRGKPGEDAVVTTTHGGDVGGRSLALGVADTATGLRRIAVAPGATRTVRTRIGADGRLFVQVGCVSTGTAARCGAAGILGFRLRAGSGRALVRAARGDAPLPLHAAPSPRI